LSSRSREKVFFLGMVIKGHLGKGSDSKSTWRLRSRCPSIFPLKMFLKFGV